MMHNVRAVELVTKEVYIDVNDLIIEFLSKADKANCEAEKKVYKELVDKLTSIRERAHKAGANHEHKF
jgi:hypothetical protein